MSEAAGIAKKPSFSTKSDQCHLLRSVVLLVFVFLCAISAANALDPNRKISQYGHTAWRIEDGAISSGSTIAQTADGYIWLGTSDSLIRFDGVNFTHWQFPKGQTLPGRTTALLGSRDGSLWIGTTRALSRLKDGQLRIFTDTANPMGISVIIEDKSGTVWATRYRVQGREGSPLCSVSGETLRCYGEKDGIPVPYGLGLTIDSAGYLWFGSKALCRWKPGVPATTYFDGKRIKGAGVIDVAAGPSGNIWGSLDGTGRELGVRYFSGGNWRSYVIPGFDGSKIWSHALLFDREGTLWVGTENDGIYRIHDGIADHYTTSDGLSGNSVVLFYEDREGNMWVRSEGGLDMFRNTPVISYTTRHGLSSAALQSVLSLRDGSVWIANEHGVDIFRKQGGATLVSRMESPLHYATAMLEDHSGAVWLAADNRIMVFQNGRFREINQPDGRPLAADVTAMAEDASHKIWLVTSRGQLLSIASDKIETQTLPSGVPRSQRFIAADSNGGLWIGSHEGLLSYYRDGHFRSLPVADNQGPIDMNGLFVDADDAVLVSTARGLYRWKNGRLTVLNTDNGLPCATIYTAIFDNHHTLWLYARCGLLRIDATELSRWEQTPNGRLVVSVFDALDGAHPGMSLLFQPLSSKAPDGRLWFINGWMAQVIDPDHLYTNAVAPPVFVEGIVGDRHTFKPQTSLQIPALTRDLRIDYTGLSFSVPQKVRFRYKLEGHDPEWLDVGTRRQAFYSDLAPGNYHFQVSACNNDGVCNESGASLNFAVLPAYYQTNWFRALCFVVFIAVLWSVHQLRVRRLRRQEEKLRDVIETMPTFAWTAKPDGSVDFVNRHWQEYTGLSTERTLGSGCATAVHPEDLRQNEEKWRAALASGQIFEDELRYRRVVDGQYRWFLSRAVPLRDTGGKVLKWYGISTDIEDRKRAEQEREQLRADLAHVNRVSLLGELAASISHELKQPISATMVNANTCIRRLKREKPDLEEACETAHNILKAGKRASEIIDRLRSLYKKAPTQRELVDVNEIVDEMVVLLRGESNRYAVSIRADLTANIPKIMADRVQLQQVLMNLMLNGIEAMIETGGVLAIKSQLGQDAQLLVSVSDTGLGLPAEKGDDIFNPFFTTKPQGSGMGLAISRSIIEFHNGHLWATRNSGPGATFHFTLPTASDVKRVPATGV
jgi:PAS domain S-box-containing protein